MGIEGSGERRIRAYRAALLAALLLGGCAGYDSLQSFQPGSGVSSQTSPDVGKYRLQTVAVLPFRNATPSPGAGQKVAGFLHDQLAATKRFRLEPPPVMDEEEEVRLQFRIRSGLREGVTNEQSELAELGRQISRFLARVRPYVTNLEVLYPGEYFEGQPEARKPGERKQLPRQVGRPGPPSESPPPLAQEALDAVITGVVTQYRNRSGWGYLGDRGAAVSYDVYLVSIRDRKVLWKASFREEQQPLFDNLLYFSRYARGGFAWQTHDQLTRYGMERVLKTFPGLVEEAPALGGD
ncbi:MAG: hypothetical protein ACE5JJ_09130 [Nitrospinota bacterium]